jgi:uncharacterized membrane protein YsdA (DUF1294 family)/cold shock CspA family protein
VTRENGILEDWHDARGFGFIRRPGAAGKIYVHMKSIGKSNERPQPGDKLTYEVGAGANGRPAALKVRIIEPPPLSAAAPAAGITSRSGTQTPPASPTADIRSTPPPASKHRREPRPGMRHISMRAAAAATIIVLIGNNVMLDHLPEWVGLLYIIGGIATFLFYQADKRAAEKREWRAPERRLHLADLTFGIVGGLLAQHVLRHKTYKPGFVTITALITALHVLTLGLIMFGVFAPGAVGDVFRLTLKG